MALIPRQRQIDFIWKPIKNVDTLTDREVVDAFMQTLKQYSIAPADFIVKYGGKVSSVPTGGPGLTGPTAKALNKFSDRFYKLYDFAIDHPGEDRNTYDQDMIQLMRAFIVNPTLSLEINLSPRVAETTEQEDALWELFFQEGQRQLDRQERSGKMPVLLLDAGYFGDKHYALNNVAHKNIRKGRQCIIFGKIDILRQLDMTKHMYAITRSASMRYYTEDILQAAGYLWRNYISIIYYVGPGESTKLTYRSWLPVFGMYIRGYEPLIIRDTRENRNDTSTIPVEAALRVIEYPCPIVQDVCQDTVRDTRARSARSSFLPSSREEKVKIWDMQPDELRRSFAKRGTRDGGCINEFVILTGINGNGFAEWIYDNYVFGDGPEAIRFSLLTGIWSDPHVPRCLLSSSQQLTIELDQPIVHCILVDEDNMLDCSDGSDFRIEEGRHIFLFGNDITYRRVKPALNKMCETREDLHYVLTCDSLRQAADIAIMTTADDLFSRGVEQITIISRDRSLYKYVDDRRKEGHTRIQATREIDDLKCR